MTIKEIVRNGAFLLDVRGQDEYEEWHVAESRLIPLSQLKETDLNIGVEEPIYIHCKMGPRAHQAKVILEEKGYQSVRVIGGLAELEDAGFDIIFGQ